VQPWDVADEGDGDAIEIVVAHTAAVLVARGGFLQLVLPSLSVLEVFALQYFSVIVEGSNLFQIISAIRSGRAHGNGYLWHARHPRQQLVTLLQYTCVSC